MNRFLKSKMAATSNSNMECMDFLEFQDSLKKMRQIDDKIIYLLNSVLPTDSFRGQVDPTNQCKDLFQQIQTGHAQREIAIKKCLDVSQRRVKQLKAQREAGQENDVATIKQLRKEQSTIRFLESELNVEEVVRSRTLSVYNEKCRSYYKPPNKVDS